jgi:class 3 adenylate cyclase/tetratricopeptide (TPR) repeat protein
MERAMTPDAQTSDIATAEIGQVLLSEQSLTDALTALEHRKSPGTVVFFDLVGSTGYRHRYKAEAGLQKAHLHNMTVSRCILAEGGKVIKWIGDAVMGCFDGKNDELHAMRAIRAALKALENLKVVNKTALLRRIAQPARRGGSENDHDIHTKIAVCSGLFHYFDLLAWSEPSARATKTSPGTTGKFADPMGGCVDLAARLTHLAKPDVIVMDVNTFWGHEVGGEDDEHRLAIRGVTDINQNTIRWRRLQLDQVRDTVYIPQVTAFFVTQSSLALSRLVQASDGVITAAQLKSLVEEEREADNLKVLPVVFAQKPVPSNIPGIDEPVSIIALSSAPSVAPLKHSRHSWPAEEVNASVNNAERAFRKGDQYTAESLFRQAVDLDPRNFHALLRLGMLARAAGDTTRALEYLTKAKESDPDCALAWAIAGMVHLDDYVHDNEVTDTRDSLVRAITGFTRAKKLAFAGFQGLLEQYCTCLLAITCFLHKGDKQALKQGKMLLDELSAWSPKNLITLRLYQLATIFLKIVEYDSTAKEILEGFQKDLEADGKRTHDGFATVPYDHVLNINDVVDLASEAVHRQKVQRPRVVQAKSLPPH